MFLRTVYQTWQEAVREIVTQLLAFEQKVLDCANITFTPAGNIAATNVQDAIEELDTAMSTFSHRNRIINGDFSVAQRGASFTSTTIPANNDDTYLLDRWYLLADGNDIVDVTQETSTVPTNGQYAIALDVETINKKFGIAQIIERKNCKGLIGGNVTLSFKAKVSATTKLDNVKAAIIAWSGTADTVTSDIVSAWGLEGTNPTLIANATYENTPANLNLTTSYATYTVTAAVDTASTANIIVFIWSDVTDTTAGDFLYITDVQLEAGSEVTSFDHRHDELQLCQRYYVRLSDARVAAAYNYSTTLAVGLMVHPVTMRIATAGISQSGTATDYGVVHNTTATTCSAVPNFSIGGVNQTAVVFEVAAGLTAGESSILRCLTNGFIGLSAEL